MKDFKTFTTTEEKIQILINGGTTIVPDEERAEVQKRLREIKNNCIEVLSQIKNN